jgi:hypothetical protein
LEYAKIFQPTRKLGEAMNTNALRVVGAVLLSVLILVTGFWLGVTGKPFNSAILNVHKLISLAGVVLFGITTYQINKTSGLDTTEMVAIVVTGVLLLSAIVSGGLSSIETMQKAVVIVHRITLSLAALATMVTLYIITAR